MSVVYSDDEWEALEQEWVDVVRARGAADAARRAMLAAKEELEKALKALERARKRTEKARERLVAACEVAEDWTMFETCVRDRTGVQ